MGKSGRKFAVEQHRWPCVRGKWEIGSAGSGSLQRGYTHICMYICINRCYFWEGDGLSMGLSFVISRV